MIPGKHPDLFLQPVSAHGGDVRAAAFGGPRAVATVDVDDGAMAEAHQVIHGLTDALVLGGVDAVDAGTRHASSHDNRGGVLSYLGEILGLGIRAEQDQCLAAVAQQCLHDLPLVPSWPEGFTKAGFSLDRAAEMFRQRGELWEEARCLRAAGEVGDPSNGLRELDFVRRAEEILTALGDSWGVARTALSAGRALARLGRIEESERELRRAVHAFEELDDRWWMALSLRYLGEAHLDSGGPHAAVEPLKQARDIYRSLGNEAGMRRTL